MLDDALGINCNDTRSRLPHDISQRRIPTTPYNLPSS
jgi:hypothetical protein